MTSHFPESSPEHSNRSLRLWPRQTCLSPGNCSVRAPRSAPVLARIAAQVLVVASTSALPRAQCPPPVAHDDTASTLVNTPVYVDPLFNDSGSMSNDPIVIVNGPSHGAVDHQGAFQLVYTPTIESNGPYCGTDAITYRLVDACGTPSNVATITIQVNGPGIGPATGDTFTWDQMVILGDGTGVLDMPLLNNDSWSGPVPSLVVVTPPLHGTVTQSFGSSYVWRYTTTSFACEGDSFTYRLRDDFHCGQSNVVTVAIQQPIRDCNGNGVSDALEVQGAGVDGDGDGVPDECSLAIGAASTRLVTVSSSGAQAFGGSRDARLSGNGRFVAFQGKAANLGPPYVQWDFAWLRDRWLGTTEVLPRTTTGGYTNVYSGDADVSDDGRFAVFSTPAPNITPGDLGGNSDIFLRDRLLGVTTMVSRTAAGIQANSSSFGSRISASGNCVVFLTSASNLVSGDANATVDVIRWDRGTGAMQLASHTPAGAAANGYSYDAEVSADGRYVVFVSMANDLVPGDTNGARDVFVFDSQTALVRRVSKSSQGLQANSDSDSPSISPDGRFVAFASWASNLVPGDTNQASDVFLHDRLAATTVRVSVGPSGQQLSGHSTMAHVSGDGEWVCFASDDGSLVPGDTNGVQDVFRRNMLTGAIDRCSVNNGGFQSNPSGLFGTEPLDISDDGHTVAFTSDAATLDGRDCGNFPDVFVRAFRPQHAEGLCFGDGSAGLCPCANTGLPGNGCGNSANSAGANLGGIGTAQVSSDTLALVASGLTPAASALFLQYGQILPAGAGVFSGDGLRCFHGSMIRLGTTLASGTMASFPPPGSADISVRGLVSAAGGLRFYSVFYRDAAAFCTVGTHNMTNGIRVLWVP